MNKELIEINEENIQMNFYIDDQEYVVLTEKPEINEGDSLYFAKKEYLDSQNIIIRNIESDEEYNRVVSKYEELISMMEDSNE